MMFRNGIVSISSPGTDELGEAEHDDRHVAALELGKRPEEGEQIERRKAGRGAGERREEPRRVPRGEGKQEASRDEPEGDAEGPDRDAGRRSDDEERPELAESREQREKDRAGPERSPESHQH